MQLERFLAQAGAALFSYLDPAERCNEAWAVYMDALDTYSDFRGCCSWDEYLDHRLLERAMQLRTEAGRRMSVESTLSLDAPPKDGANTPRVDLLKKYHGDFQGSVIFRDFLHNLGAADPDAGILARELAGGGTFAEFSADYGWDEQRTDRALRAVRSAVQAYMEI